MNTIRTVDRQKKNVKTQAKKKPKEQPKHQCALILELFTLTTKLFASHKVRQGVALV